MNDHTTHESPYKEIPLSGKHGRGKVALVDAADYDWLMQWKWYCQRGTHTDYAASTVRADGQRLKTLLMHRLITGVPRGTKVDHENLNGLDNRRGNLRAATQSQNSQNRPKQSGHYTSQYKGVFLEGRTEKWNARIKLDGNTTHLGTFPTEWAAAHAYNTAAIAHFGEYARLNELPEKPPVHDAPILIREPISKFIGVYWEKRIGKWFSRIQSNGVETHVGTFENELEAALARDEVARKLNNPRIKLNFTR